jgi:type IV secretory pathway VirB3-like protein
MTMQQPVPGGSSSVAPAEHGKLAKHLLVAGGVIVGVVVLYAILAFVISTIHFLIEGAIAVVVIAVIVWIIAKLFRHG